METSSAEGTAAPEQGALPWDLCAEQGSAPLALCPPGVPWGWCSTRCSSLEQTCSIPSPAWANRTAQDKPGKNRRHTMLVDGNTCGYTCGNGREDQETPLGRHSLTAQRGCIFNAMFFPCPLTLQHFHSTMPSQAVVTGHSAAALGAELVLLQPAPLPP